MFDGWRRVMVIAGLVSGLSHGAVGSLAMWQAQETVPIGGGHLVEIFVVIAGIALFAQAAVIVALALALMKAIKTVTAYAAEIKPKVLPIIGKTQEIVDQVKTTAAELSPKINDITAKVAVITGNVSDMSGMVKEKVAEFGPTVDKVKETINSANEAVLDATQKTHEQVQRVNQMVTDSLDATAKASKSFRHTITQPGRSISGAVDGVKAAVTNFFASKKTKPGTYRAPYRSNPAQASSGSTASRTEGSSGVI